MHSLYTNEVTVPFKLAVISLNFIHQHLKNNANPCVCSIALVSKISYKFWELAEISFWPFKLRILSSTLKILGLHNNRMENKCWVVLKRCVNVIGKRTRKQVKIPHSVIYKVVTTAVSYYQRLSSTPGICSKMNLRACS